MTSDRFWEEPRAPLEVTPEPWSDLPPDLAHPGINGDGTGRLFLDRHWHALHHDQNDEFETVSATAVFQQSAGGAIEFGPWSMSPADARILATSLNALADAAEPDGVGR